MHICRALGSVADRDAQTAGDIAYSMGHHDAYEALVAEGVRAEMIRAILPTEEEDEEMECVYTLSRKGLQV